jgi:Family of unknown function (DUF6459)
MRPPIRLRPVPQCDPPFDDELALEVWAPADQPAFDWPPPARRSTPADVEPLARTGGSKAASSRSRADSGRSRAGSSRADSAESRAGSDGSRADLDGSRAGSGATRADFDGSRVRSEGSRARSGRSARSRAGAAAGSGSVGPGIARVEKVSGDAHLAVRRFVGMCVEVLNGYRPAAHLRRLTLPREAAGVVAQGMAGAQRVTELRRAAARPGNRHARRPGPVAVLKLRLCEPRAGAVEAAVLLITGDRTWAMALRLEIHQEAWTTTALRLL